MDRNDLPLIGASIPTGLGAAEDYIKLKLGNFVLIALPKDKEEAKKVLRFFREKKVYMVLAEFIHRNVRKERWFGPEIPAEEFPEIFAEGGEYLLGRASVGEVGGKLYWPREYTLDGARGEYDNIPPCKTVTEAHDRFVAFMKERLEYERTQIAPGPFLNTDSSIVFPWYAEAGCDILCLEMMPGDPLLLLSSIRGTARAAGKLWGVHIAIGWYGGWKFDEIWLKRWKFSLYLSYIGGAEFIYPESGHYIYHNLVTKEYNFHSPETHAIRRVLREICRFNQIHHRPDGGPMVRFGVVHGQDDGHPGIWNPFVWGQYEDGCEWESGPAEHGWFLLRQFRRKQDPLRIELSGDRDTSGNPPEGQYDVVPAFAETFANYRKLMFLGYNRMDEKLYGKLIDYVKQGGHLLIWLPHFNASAVHGEIELLNNGDLSGLCGFRVTGQDAPQVKGMQLLRQPEAPGFILPMLPAEIDPIYLGRMTTAHVEITDPSVRILAGVTCGRATQFTDEDYAAHPLLIERKLGKGYIWTVSVLNWPGDVGMRSFAETLMRAFAASARPADAPDLLAPDTVRWAVYPGKFGKIFYMLNTDPDLSASVQFVQGRDRAGELRIPAADLRLAFTAGDLLISPEDRNCELRSGGTELRFDTREQKMFFRNFGTETLCFAVNGKKITLAPHGETEEIVPAQIPAEKKELFDDRYLEEAEIEPAAVKVPY